MINLTNSNNDYQSNTSLHSSKNNSQTLREKSQTSKKKPPTLRKKSQTLRQNLQTSNNGYQSNTPFTASGKKLQTSKKKPPTLRKKSQTSNNGYQSNTTFTTSGKKSLTLRQNSQTLRQNPQMSNNGYQSNTPFTSSGKKSQKLRQKSQTLRMSNNILPEKLSVPSSEVEKYLFGKSLPFEILENRIYYNEKGEKEAEDYDAFLKEKLENAREELNMDTKILKNATGELTDGLENINLSGGASIKKFFKLFSKRNSPDSINIYNRSIINNWEVYLTKIIKKNKLTTYKKLLSTLINIQKKLIAENKKNLKKISDKGYINTQFETTFNNWENKIKKTIEIIKDNRSDINLDFILGKINRSEDLEKLYNTADNGIINENNLDIIREIYPFPNYQKLVKVNYEDNKVLPLYGMQSPFDIMGSSSKLEACQLMSYLMFTKGIKTYISLQENPFEKYIWDTLKLLHPYYKTDKNVKYVDLIINDYCPMSLDIAKKVLTLIKNNFITPEKQIPTVIHCGAGCGRTGIVMMLIRMYIDALQQNTNIFSNDYGNGDELFDMLNTFYRYNPAEGKSSIVEISKSIKEAKNSPAIEFFNMEGKGRIVLLRNNMNIIRYSIYAFLKPAITHIDFYKRAGIKKTSKLEEQAVDTLSVSEIEAKIKSKDNIFKATYFAKSSY